jgi:SOS-response transcriptional repressor LexA
MAETDIERRKENLRRYLADNALSQAELGRLAGMTRGYISMLLDPGKPGGKNTFQRLEKALSLPADYFSRPIEDLPPGGKVLPLYDWEQAGTRLEAERCGLATSPYNTGPRAFALRVQNRAMMSDRRSKQLLPGMVAIVDPDAVCRSDDYIVVRIGLDAAPVCRELAIDGGQRYVRPLNAEFGGVTKLTQDDEIVGRIAGAYWPAF